MGTHKMSIVVDEDAYEDYKCINRILLKSGDGNVWLKQLFDSFVEQNKHLIEEYSNEHKSVEHKEAGEEDKVYFYDQNNNKCLLNYKDPVQYRADKANLIAQNIERLKPYKGFLRCYDNGHIQAKAKSGKIMNYYACTGTITGYSHTDKNGIDDFIELLEKC